MSSKNALPTLGVTVCAHAMPIWSWEGEYMVGGESCGLYMLAAGDTESEPAVPSVKEFPRRMLASAAPLGGGVIGGGGGRRGNEPRGVLTRGVICASKSSGTSTLGVTSATNCENCMDCKSIGASVEAFVGTPTTGSCGNANTPLALGVTTLGVCSNANFSGT